MHVFWFNIDEMGATAFVFNRSTQYKPSHC